MCVCVCVGGWGVAKYFVLSQKPRSIFNTHDQFNSISSDSNERMNDNVVHALKFLPFQREKLLAGVGAAVVLLLWLCDGGSGGDFSVANRSALANTRSQG